METTWWTKFPDKEYLGLPPFLLVFWSKLGTLSNGNPFEYPSLDLDLTYDALLEKTMTDCKAFTDNLAQRL